jgi:hypothetical protein
MKRADLIASVEATFAACLDICRKKNADYSSGDDALKNLRVSEMIGVSAAKAVLVRCSDKFTRLGNLLDKPPSVTEESIEDTARDLINYMALFIAILDDAK